MTSDVLDAAISAALECAQTGLLRYASPDV